MSEDGETSLFKVYSGTRHGPFSDGPLEWTLPCSVFHSAHKNKK